MHKHTPTATAGLPLEEARAAMIIVHGRGDTAPNILALADALQLTGFAFLAPQAYQNSWYPNSFLAPMESNQPGLDSSLAKIGELVKQIEAAGIPAEKIMIGGFSQGACLSSEFAARNAKAYGGIFVLSGGVIGPPETPRNYSGSMAGTPVFLGCSDIDFHIPVERVHETAVVFEALGAHVDKRIYPNMGHTVNADEIEAVKMMAQKLVD
ncbi:MAG: putative esterase [Cellvibrionaceae bacterium]|jgi:predicted esterase